MTSSEQIAEQAMTSFWECYEAGNLESGITLLNGFDYRQNVVNFVFAPDSYYVPNRRGSRLVRPRSVSDDLIPIVALEAGTDVRFERPSLHYLQKIALMLAQYPNSDIDAIDAKMRNIADKHINIAAESAGRNDISLIKSEETRGRFVQARPVLIINTNHDHTEKNICTDVVLHELTHLTQGLSDPFYPTEHAALATRELEACAIQSTLLREFHIPYTASMQMATEIDGLRKKYLGDDGYVPDATALEGFLTHEATAKVFEKLAADAAMLKAL